MNLPALSGISAWKALGRSFQREPDLGEDTELAAEPDSGEV